MRDMPKRRSHPSSADIHARRHGRCLYLQPCRGTANQGHAPLRPGYSAAAPLRRRPYGRSHRLVGRSPRSACASPWTTLFFARHSRHQRPLADADGTLGVASEPDPGLEALPACKASLHDALATAENGPLPYNYDPGDDWRHCLRAELTDGPLPGQFHPRLAEAEGRCPPEDAAGTGRVARRTVRPVRAGHRHASA